MNATYRQTVSLLLEIAPVVFNTSCFAMKGGTAINLFVQDMPRLSVDIDVVFCDHSASRDEALAKISSELHRIEYEIKMMGHETNIKKINTGEEVKIFVVGPDAQVKVEVNFIFRGTVLPVELHSLTDKTQQIFSTNIQIPILSPAELYGSKLVAAMDRQHPRDLFDVMKMYESHGLTEEILDCFVVYLAGHNRPVHEVLFSNPQPINEIFHNEFAGMTAEILRIDDLVSTRTRLMEELPAALTKNHKDFLLSLVQAKPDWDSLPYTHLKYLPALQWKLKNLSRLKANYADRFALQHAALKARLPR